MGVTQKFIGDSGHLTREYEKILAQQAKLDQALHRSTESQHKAGRHSIYLNQSILSGIKSATANVKGLAAQYVSLATVMNAAKLISDQEQARADRAKQTAMSVADSQAGVIKNLGRVDDAGAKQFLGRIDQIREESGAASVVPLNQAAASLLSATAGDREQTAAILKDSAKLFRDNMTELPVFAGSIADMMKLAGTTNVKAVMGAGLAVQGQARFEDLTGLKNVTVAMAAAKNANPLVDGMQTLRESSSVFAALSSISPDVTGDRTKTAVASLAAKLGPLSEGGIFEDLETLRNQTAKEQAKFFMSGFEVDKMDVMKSLLDRDSQFSKSIEASFAEIQLEGQLVDDKIRQLETLTPELRRANRDAVMQGTIESAERRGSLDYEARDIYQKYAGQTRTGFQHYWDNNIYTPLTDITQGWSPETAIRKLEHERSRLVNEQAFRQVFWGMPAGNRQYELATIAKGIEQLVELQKENQMRNGSGPVNARAQTRTQEGLGGVDQ